MRFVRRLLAWLLNDRGQPLRDTSPADGVVEIHSIEAPNSTPNARDPRFRRFAPPLITPSSALSARRPYRTSFPPLLGRFVVGSLFLGQDGRRWSEVEEAQALASLIGAGEWIERQAMHWAAPVNVRLLDVFFAGEDLEPRPAAQEIAIVLQDHDESLSESYAEVRMIASLGRALEPLGFRGLADFASQLVSRVEADALVWVVHVRAAGRSFVISDREVGIPGVSLAICFAREDDFPSRLRGPVQPDPATFAHELLHLFGATDKYGAPISSFPAGSVTRREIMRLDVERLSQLRIDPLTAREIGWPEHAKPPASTGQGEAGGG